MAERTIKYDIHVIGSLCAIAPFRDALEKEDPRLLDSLGLSGEKLVGRIGFRPPEGIDRLGKIKTVKFNEGAHEATTSPDGITIASRKLVFITGDKSEPISGFPSKVVTVEYAANGGFEELVLRIRKGGVVGVGLSPAMLEIYTRLASTRVRGGVTALFYGDLESACEAVGLDKSKYDLKDLRVVQRQTLSSRAEDVLLSSSDVIISGGRRVNMEVDMLNNKGSELRLKMSNGQSMVNEDHQLLGVDGEPIRGAWGLGTGFGFIPIEVAAAKVASQLRQKLLG